jgi:ketosteroid isomerase-like protein
MSEENVEIVRPVYEAFNRRDWDAVFRDMHPDFKATTKRGPNAGTHHRREGAQAFFEDYVAAFDDLTAEPKRFLASGNQIVVLVTQRGKPKGGEVQVAVRNGHLWTLEDGRVLSMETFPNPQDALEAAGLRE